MHAHRREAVPDGGPDPVRRQRARHAERRKAGAVTHPGGIPGPPDGCLPLRRGQAGQQVEDRVPALDIDAHVQPARQV